MAFVTTSYKLDDNNVNQLWLLPVKMDKNTIEFGDPLKHWNIPSDPTAFVHGVSVDSLTREVYFLSAFAPILHPKCRPASPRLERIGVFTVPEFPKRFRATAIMHPFNGSQLVIAGQILITLMLFPFWGLRPILIWCISSLSEILYDYSKKMMLFDCFGMKGGHFKFIIRRNKCYVQDSEMKTAHLVKGMSTIWELPPPNWFKNLSPNYVGKQSIHGVETIWWRYAQPNFKKTQSPGRSLNKDQSDSIPSITELFQSHQQNPQNNWFWFDNAGYLLRVMFPNPRNIKFPVLSDFAVVHLPVFEELSETEFPTNLKNSELKNNHYLDKHNRLKNVTELLTLSSTLRCVFR